MRRCASCRGAFEGGSWTCPACGFAPSQRAGFLDFGVELEEGRGGFSVEGFRQLFDTEAGHFWFRARNRLIAWAVRTYFGDARSMLEVGCGTGFVLSHLEEAFPGITFAGGEAYAEALEFAATRLRRTSLYRLDARRLPFEDELDLVGAFDVLEHVPEDEEALSELRLATRKGGGLLLTVPQHTWLWSDADVEAHHVRRYAAKELVAKVERAGFEVIRKTSFVTALLPPMVASRFASRRAARSDARVSREFSLSRPLNAVFGAALAAERLAIEAGASLPVGGSLLLAARRVR